jgi:hypothetical protein
LRGLLEFNSRLCSQRFCWCGPIDWAALMASLIEPSLIATLICPLWSRITKQAGCSLTGAAFRVSATRWRLLPGKFASYRQNL